MTVYAPGAFAVIPCDSAPPSDQEEKSQTFGNAPCGASASTLLSEPLITVRVKRAGPVKVPTESCRPAGDVWNERSTVCGWIVTLAVFVSPCASIAVSWISRYDGYSWSGAGK